jgi:hypothetical protein
MAIKINRKPIILKKKENTEVIIPEKNDIEDILKYDYNKLENFSDDDKNQLIIFEKSIITKKENISSLALQIGQNLEEARKLFDRYSENPSSYMEWYQALGFNKDQVSLLRGRYKLSLSYPQYNNLISDFSDREVKALVNKKVNVRILENILSSGIRTDKEIRKAISSMLEIEDAEIVEESEKDKLVSRLSEVEAKIRKLEEELKELKTVKAELKEKIKGLS